MSSLVLLFGCLGLGAIAARLAHPPEGTAGALNWWVINIALPAATLAAVPQLSPSRELWFLAAPSWFSLAGAYLVFSFVGRARGWTPERIGAVVLVAGLGNTSFIGFPLLEALRGPGALPYAVVADQLGTFAALATLGALVVTRFGVKRSDRASGLRQLVMFPPFVALCAGVIVGLAGGWPPAVEGALARIAGTLSPIALFSVGLRVKLRITRTQLAPLAMALGWRLLVVPLAAWGLAIATSQRGPVLVVGVLEAAMAPMISAAIIAEREGLDGELANTILTIGILVAFGSVAIFDALLPAF